MYNEIAQRGPVCVGRAGGEEGTKARVEGKYDETTRPHCVINELLVIALINYDIKVGRSLWTACKFGHIYTVLISSYF